MRKKQTIFKCSCIIAVALSCNVSMSFSQTRKNEVSPQRSDSVSNNKEVKDRNIMLNAGSNVGPRDVNIGLPFNGDVVILENDLPVVYSFWPQFPTTAWRYDNSLSRLGLLNYQESAITTGRVGYAVSSWDRFLGKATKFKGFASVYLNGFGGVKADVDVVGPLGKNGWSYAASVHQSFDRDGVNYGFTKYNDRSQIYKFGISKKLKTGTLSLSLRHYEVNTIYGGYNPFIFKGDGKTVAMENFRTGLDTYIVTDGIIPYIDKSTGNEGTFNIKDQKTISNVVDFIGDFNLKNNWKLAFSNRFMKSDAPFTVQMPATHMYANEYEPQGFSFSRLSDGSAYTGPIQMVASIYIPTCHITTVLNRITLTKKVDNHALRIGLQHQLFINPELDQSMTLFYQTATANPVKLAASINTPWGTFPMTNSGGALASAKGLGGGYSKNNLEDKTALYFSDDWAVTKKLDLSYGARVELYKTKSEFSTYVDEVVANRPLKKFDETYLNKVGSISLVYKAFKQAGLTAEATYNEIKNSQGLFNADFTHEFNNNQPVLFGAVGAYYSNPLFNVVSKGTIIRKNNLYGGLQAYNPENPTQSQSVNSIVHNLQTMGWTTDVITTPFKNFNLHFLLTLQNPIYQGYKFSAYNKEYNYSGNNIPELSKVLIEIDPSYTLLDKKLKLWASFRYFGKQPGNLANALYYNGWWETFGGVDYKLNNNVDFKFQVVNFFNQRGVKGTIQGADLITDQNLYINKVLVSSPIRPLTFELTTNIKF
jgi:hypothetical protein